MWKDEINFLLTRPSRWSNFEAREVRTRWALWFIQYWVSNLKDSTGLFTLSEEVSLKPATIALIFHVDDKIWYMRKLDGPHLLRRVLDLPCSALYCIVFTLSSSVARVLRMRFAQSLQKAQMYLCYPGTFQTFRIWNQGLGITKKTGPLNHNRHAKRRISHLFSRWSPSASKKPRILLSLSATAFDRPETLIICRCSSLSEGLWL